MYTKKIIIPDGTKYITNGEFLNSTTIEEVVIPDSVIEIGCDAFNGCINLKKVKLPKNLRILNRGAFENCKSLESINIPKSLHYISSYCFYNDQNLKNIQIHDHINYIDEYAFYNCHELEPFKFSKFTTSIGKFAFFGCHKFTNLFIPKDLTTIEVGAFANIENLTTIEVDKKNQKYFSLNNNTLVDRNGIIMQYAINSPNEEFTVGYYDEPVCEIYNDDGKDFLMSYNSLIYNIADHAFEGAKNLKVFTIPSELESIGNSTFKNCPNLKTLNIFKSVYGDTFTLNIFGNYIKENAYVPFEIINFEDNIKFISSNLANLFKNATQVKLPSNLEGISSNVFSKSDKLEKLFIPESIQIIQPNTFHPNTTLKCPFFGTIKAKNFETIQTKTSNSFYKKYNNVGNIKIFSLKDGTYYVKIDDYDIVKITKNEILKLSNSAKNYIDKPENVILNIIDLINIHIESQNIINNLYTDEKLFSVLSNIVNDSTYIEEIYNHKINNIIRKMLCDAEIHDEALFSSLIINKFKKEGIEKIINNYNKSLSRFLKNCKYKEDEFINIYSLIKYCNLLEKYQKYDRFLYNTNFLQNINENTEKLIKYYNKNIKRLLINSKVFESNYAFNLDNLLSLCNALCIFSDNNILSQKMCMFLIDYMFNENNEDAITGDAIHSVFSDIKQNIKPNKDLAIFFIDNYKDLIKCEKENPGILARIINYFDEIMKTSTSHKGSQRQLKVTLNKCLDFFLMSIFDNVTKDNIELAKLLQKFYSEKETLSVASNIYKNCLKAPRNIFTKVIYKENEIIYSYDENEDLKEEGNKFNYEWLPKQSYDNLILGKYCSCCAHILGSGAGIMRASMILDNCQNLVIRNSENEIIAKATIYVNKEQGYAVYNTIEINLKYEDDLYLKDIYNAFIRGTNAFLEKYNENNEIPINIITIGQNRNKFEDLLPNDIINPFNVPDYSTYGYFVGSKNIGNYAGDAKNKQLLVIKK